MTSFAQMHTPDGNLCGEVASALQKAIRRGREREALYWASQLDKAGFGLYVWRRLRIIASEDVGLADNDTVLLVNTLYENWLEARGRVSSEVMKTRWPRLFVTHAVLLLARAHKSRIVDHAAMVAYDGDERFEIPDYALDRHTKRGRRRGRGIAHFFDVASLLANEGLDDPYREEAREIKLKAETEQTSM